ncbi:MAG: NAD(P)/FAD-dependent oxidoreductase [Burkholderiales bacterium]
MSDIAVIGAGPYGLSIAAHLEARNLDYRIIGRPMEMWREHMPAGMRLKSDGFASSLSNPGRPFTIGDFCRSRGIPYADSGLPIALDTFVDYCLEFKTRYVPRLEDALVTFLGRTTEGFNLELSNGQTASAKHVVVAVGLTYYAFTPPALATLPAACLSHSSAHRDAERFRAKKVAIIGGGSSALDLAAELHQAGADVHLVCRAPTVRIHDPPVVRSALSLQHAINPITVIGSGWKSYLCVRAPLVFRCMPQAFRFAKVRQIAGPAGGWFIRDRVEGKVNFHTGITVRSAEPKSDGAVLTLVDERGGIQSLDVDHVIAATGYRVDLRRLDFIESGLRSEIRAAEHTPVLSSHFESSIPGLYFVGVTAANTFGPLLRFACGADFTARRLSDHLARTLRRVHDRNGPPRGTSGPASGPV